MRRGEEGERVDRSRGEERLVVFDVFAYLHGFRVNYKCGTWPYLGQPEPDRSLSCSNQPYVVPHANDARVASACDNAFDNVDNGDVYICIGR